MKNVKRLDLSSIEKQMRSLLRLTELFLQELTLRTYIMSFLHRLANLELEIYKVLVGSLERERTRTEQCYMISQTTSQSRVKRTTH